MIFSKIKIKKVEINDLNSLRIYKGGAKMNSIYDNDNHFQLNII